MCWWIFNFVCFLVDEKIKLKVVASSFEISNFENLSINPFQRPWSGDLNTENAQEAACDYEKSYRLC